MRMRVWVSMGYPRPRRNAGSSVHGHESVGVSRIREQDNRCDARSGAKKPTPVHRAGGCASERVVQFMRRVCPSRCDAMRVRERIARCANTTDCRAAHCSKAYSTATTQASCPLLARPCARRLSRSLKKPSHAGHIDVEESSDVVVVVEYLRWARA